MNNKNNDRSHQALKER